MWLLQRTLWHHSPAGSALLSQHGHKEDSPAGLEAIADKSVQARRRGSALCWGPDILILLWSAAVRQVRPVPGTQDCDPISTSNQICESLPRKPVPATCAEGRGLSRVASSTVGMGTCLCNPVEPEQLLQLASSDSLDQSPQPHG